ncbi:hypothetical protein F383_16692 [Gossypium arboreum]|uniref:Uncharacterized protein n=1 Tax=Gossypium arboreum TaxID=29729 RepID=A0A0B0MLY9_GOSAR|nr:hypothetical protein F383_16692 [Gossypium arboreum]
MASHAHVPGHVLGRAKPVGYTNLCHIAKTHARVLDCEEHTDLISN